MKVFLLASVLISTSSFAQQPTKAQLDKMQKDMEKKAASLQKSIDPGGRIEAENEAAFKAPKKQVKLLAALPRTNFILRELNVKYENKFIHSRMPGGVHDCFSTKG